MGDARRPPKTSPASADAAAELRRHAEERLDGLLAGGGASPSTPVPKELAAAVHELRVHQIELEIQNEELRRDRLELEASRARYLDLYDQAPVGYLTLSESSLILQANVTAAAKLGAPLAELLGRPLTHFIVAADEDVFYLCRRALFEAGQPQHCELRLLTIDGAPLWMHFEGALSHDGPDGALACHATLTDVTESKLAEEAHREDRALLRAIVNGTTDAVYVKDCEGRYILFNAAAEGVTGKCAADVLGKDDRFLFPPHEAAVVMGGDRQAMSMATATTYEETVTDAAGRAVTFLSTKGPVYDAGGKLLGLFGIARDITARKRAEETIRESEHNFRAFFETVDDIIVVATPDGRIVYANPALSAKLGYSAEEAKTLHVLDLNPTDRRAAAEAIFAAMLRGERDRCPLPLQAKSGALIPAETRVAFGQWDGVDCVFGICKDLTTEQEALQKFDQLFHGSPAMTALNSVPEGRFIEVNEAFLRAHGYDREEVIGHTGLELGLFVEPDQYRALAEMLLAQGRVSDRELRVRCKDGSILDGLFSMEVVKSQAGLSVLTVMVDETGRKRAEERLRASEEQLASAVEGSGVGLWDWYPQTGEETFNERWAEIAGHTLAELAPTSIETWRDLCHPGDLRRAEELLEEHFAGQSPIYECETRMRHKDGRWVWVLDRGKVSEWDSDGRPLRMIGTQLDISERKQAAEEVARALSLLESTMESTADGILVADGKGAMVRFNARFTEVCGIPEAIAASKDDDAALGFVLDQLKEPELFLQAVRDLYASPEKTSFDVLELKDGRVLERYSQPQRIDDSVVGRVWSFRDVTERKRAEQALRLQSRLQQLLMGMSAKYIDLPLEEVGAAIDDSLRELGGGSSRPTGPTWSTMTSTGRSARAPTHGAPRALSRRSTPCRR